jgi:hypothetical protein
MYRRKIIVLLPLLLFTSLLLTGCSSSNQGLSVGDTAPDFTLTSSDYQEVSLSEYAGEPVLLYFHMALG